MLRTDSQSWLTWVTNRIIMQITSSPEFVGELNTLRWQTAAETCGRPGGCVTAPAQTQTTRDADHQWSVCTLAHWPTSCLSSETMQEWLNLALGQSLASVQPRMDTMHALTGIIAWVCDSPSASAAMQHDCQYKTCFDGCIIKVVNRSRPWPAVVS